MLLKNGVEKKRDNLWGKFLYGIFFLCLYPLFLVLFTLRVEIPLSIQGQPFAGGVFFLAGMLIMAQGMWALLKRGKVCP